MCECVCVFECIRVCWLVNILVVFIPLPLLIAGYIAFLCLVMFVHFPIFWDYGVLLLTDIGCAPVVEHGH